jgi:hypothetical protein
MCKNTLKPRSWGFRFYATDAAVIVSATACVMALKWRGSPLWWMLATVVGHFFLFCNLVRLRRRFEITWALLFVLNVGIWSASDQLSAFHVLGGQFPVTAALITAELRSSRYHGIFARRLNTRLDDYLEERIP